MHRPHPHVRIDPSEIFGIKYSGLPQRQERDDHIFEKYSRLKKNFRGHSFWVRGYYVSTVGLDEAKVRKYIKDQEINESVEDRYDTDLSNPF